MKKIALILSVIFVTALLTPMTAFADTVTAGGFYNIGTVEGVSVVPESSDTPIAEIEVDVDNDGTPETLYANSDKLAVTYSEATKDAYYGIMLVQGSDVPTKDDEIFYLDQKTATSDTITFNVFPKLPEDTTELTLYISSSNEDESLVSIPLNYAKKDTYSNDVVIRPTFSSSMQANLTLEANVYLNIYFKLENMETLDPETLQDNVGLLVWDAEDAPAAEDATFENCSRKMVGGEWNASDGRFKVRSEGIPAKELGDAITFRPYLQNEDGSYTYGKIVSNYCPSVYCYKQLKDTNAKDDELMVTILNYGAAAQEFLKYRTDALMNADLTEDQKLIEWDGSLVRTDWSIPESKAGDLVRSSKITSRTANLTLLGAIDYNYQIAVDKSVNVADVKILCWTESDYNAVDTLTTDNATLVADMIYDSSKGKYEYKYEGLPAKKMFSPIYTCAVVTDTDGNEYYGGVVAYCPERFAYISTTSSTVSDAEKKLAKCIVIYGDAARRYFN